MTVHPHHAAPSHRRRIGAWGAAALLVLSPLLAMQVTEEVDWGVFDFIAAAVLVGGLGLAWEVTARVTRSRARRRVMAATLAAVFLLIWAELAVGVF